MLLRRKKKDFITQSGCDTSTCRLLENVRFQQAKQFIRLKEAFGHAEKKKRKKLFTRKQNRFNLTGLGIVVYIEAK